jgi:signal transduction histidine kinase
MFRSLRTKLAIAFGLITLLSIVSVGVGSLFLLRDREIKAATQRTGDLLPPEAKEVGSLARMGATQEQIAGYLRLSAQQLNVRFILLNSDSQILLDTAGKLSGQFTANTAGKSGRNLPNSYHVTGYQEGPTRYILYTQPSGALAYQGLRTLVPTNYNVLMLVPEKSITSAWTDLAPRLMIAGSIALIASLAVALLVARSISRPLVGITGASEAMAHGNYQQRIPVVGRDEVARLARSFNGMAAQVSRSDRMMRDLLANVAHELKTPLTSIQGFSQALADGSLHSTDEYSSAARIIIEESERMRRLVNDLLYLSQIESGQIPLEVQTVPVSTLMSDTAERVQWLLAGDDRRLVVEPAGALPPVRVDPLRMEQVLANLLDNAIRYTPAGGEISMSATAAGTNRIRIDVHNTGSFIPPEEIDRIFERFYQVDRSRKRNGRNGGLGLAIAREIVSAHGGEISASSDPQSGTTFSVAMPAAAADAPEPGSEEQLELQRAI